MKKICKILIAVMVLAIAGAGILALTGSDMRAAGDGPSYNASALSEKLSVSMDNWSYDNKNDIYYQTGLVYCMNPEDESYESCAIYVPGEYFEASENSNATYTCGIKSDAKTENYSVSKAPIVMPVNTPGYSSCKAPSTYNADEVKDYTDAGFIYLSAECLGRDNGEAPDGVCDLKAAVSYYRFNGDILPGDSENILAFGQSGVKHSPP